MNGLLFALMALNTCVFWKIKKIFLKSLQRIKIFLIVQILLVNSFKTWIYLMNGKGLKSYKAFRLYQQILRILQLNFLYKIFEILFLSSLWSIFQYFLIAWCMIYVFNKWDKTNRKYGKLSRLTNKTIYVIIIVLPYMF